MQSRSWTAALALATALIGTGAPRSIADEPAPIKQKVELLLKFDGLSTDGGEVEIKPGNGGTKFETIKFKTKGHPRTMNDGKIKLDPIEVETLSADGNCSFTITLKETGLPDKVVRRNLRFKAPAEGQEAKPTAMTCYISSNSLKPVVAEKPKEDTKKKP
jgi:hypothetical protein